MKKTKTRLLCLLLTVAALLVLAACETDTPDASAKFAPFSVGGVTVTVGEEAAPILERLGTPVSSAETAGCYGDGKDKVYQYRSYKVFTYSMGGVDYILSVELFDDSDETVKTAEGIGVGDSREAVLARYGEATEADDSKLIYQNGADGTKLQFLLRNGAVTNIQYLKTDA